ncbi:MAG: molybdate ABC transporter substrate-binding protein [Sedimentitalea sp.]
MPPALTRRRVLSLAASLAGFPAFGATPATIFAAASLKTALDAVFDGQARLSYGASSAMARQILYGAPADIFVSANPQWMDVVEQDGLVVPGTRVDLLSNELVLVAGQNGPAQADLNSDLVDALAGDRLAIASVETVPAGQYAKAALQHLGHWDALKSHLAQAESVRAALRLVALGEAPLGIVYATDALIEPRVRVLARIPDTAHPKILYPAALLKQGGHAQARAAYDLLTSASAQTVFRRYGFRAP